MARCPTCASSNPWFTQCLDPDDRDKYGRPMVDGEVYDNSRRGCADPWHLEPVSPNPEESKP